MARSWSVREFFVIWLGGIFGTFLFFLVGEAIGRDDWVILFGLAGQYAGNLLVYWLYARAREDADVGFTIQGKDFGYIALGLVLQVVLAIAFLPLSNLLFPDGQPPQEIADVISEADSTELIVGLILAAVVLAPVTEELLFRGVLLKALEPRGKRFAVVVSALVFSAVHGFGLSLDDSWARSAAVVLPPLFIIGIVLAWLTQRMGRLGPAIFLHSGWNLLAAFVLLLPPELLEQVG